ncbi:MAG: hypothetical protein ACLFVR_00260 [Thiohalospira sp.]
MSFREKILLVLLFCIVFMAIVFICAKNQKLIQVRQEYLINKNELQIKVDDLKQIRLMEIQSEKSEVDNFNIIDKNNTIKDFVEVIDDDVLIFRIFENTCLSCIEENLSALDTLVKTKPVIILGNFYNSAAYTFFKEQYNLNNCYMFESNSKINIPMETNEIMYYFLINKQMEVYKVHIPIKWDFDFTLTYLSSIDK